MGGKTRTPSRPSIGRRIALRKVSADNFNPEDYPVQRSESNHASQAAVDRQMPRPLPGGDAQVLAQIESSELAVRLVPEKVARRHEVVPIAVDNRVLTYATCAP